MKKRGKNHHPLSIEKKNYIFANIETDII